MAKQEHKDERRSVFIYSTDPDFKPEEESAMEAATLLPAQQPIVISLDTRHRAGKAVTLLAGFRGSIADREELGKKLKHFCGTGGAVKDEGIIVQGDNRDKVLQWLHKNGYTAAKKR